MNSLQVENLLPQVLVENMYRLLDPDDSKSIQFTFTVLENIVSVMPDVAPFLLKETSIASFLLYVRTLFDLIVVLI